MLGKPVKVIIRGKPRWRVDFRDPLTGARCRPVFATKAEADAYQEKVNTDPRAKLHPLVDPTVTLNDYAALWLAREHGWTSRKTREGYEGQVQNHVLPFPLGAGRKLGSELVRNLHRGHIKALIETKAREGYAPDSVRLCFQTIAQLCNAAVGDHLLPTPPIDRALVAQLRPLMRQKTDKLHFTLDQMRTFLATAEAEHSRLTVLYRIGFLTGARLGELVGLWLDDLILVNGQPKLRIERQLLPGGSTTKPEPVPPKGAKTRLIDASAALVALWDQLKAERRKLTLRKGWRPAPPWAFLTKNGTPYDHSAVASDFKSVLEDAKLPTTLTPHSMRHSYATAYVEHRGKQANFKWLSNQLGHASVAFTLDRYAKHARPEDYEAADALGDLLAGNNLATDAISSAS